MSGDQAEICISTAFFHNVTEYPSRQQKVALAERVAKIPGCEGYTHARVQAYFKDKRKQRHRRAARCGDEPVSQSPPASPAPPPAPAPVEPAPRVARGEPSVTVRLFIKNL